MKFPDVDYSKWYGEFIERASDEGIMVGDDQGNFRPGDLLTRAEAAVVVCRLLDKIGRGNKPHQGHRHDHA